MNGKLASDEISRQVHILQDFENASPRLNLFFSQTPVFLFFILSFITLLDTNIGLIKTHVLLAFMKKSSLKCTSIYAADLKIKHFQDKIIGRLRASQTLATHSKQASCFLHLPSVLTLAVPLFRCTLQQNR